MILKSNLLKMKFSILILILGFLINDSMQDVGSFSPFNLRLYHNLGQNNEYINRGTISVRFNRNLIGIYNQDNPLTSSELDKLKDLCKQNRIYLIKAVQEDKLPVKSSEAFLNACSFINSNLLERLVVNLDFNGEFLSLSTHTDNYSCENLEKPLNSDHFNTSVYVMQTSTAPIPDTQTYIQRLEVERQEKLKGDGPDNRSFLAKYWIYIVPVAILVLISSASNQEEGGS